MPPAKAALATLELPRIEGTIKVKMNGALLGTMVSRSGGRGRPVTAVAGVCWVAAALTWNQDPAALDLALRVAAAQEAHLADEEDRVDAEGAVVTKTGARCLLRRGDALLRSNVDAHGRVDHQMDVAYDGKVLEVHFFSRRHFLRTTETIAVVEDATSDDVLDELERRVNDADFVLPEALVQWRAPATRKGLVPEPLDALRCVAELLPAGCAGSMTLRERACWRGNGAPAARAYQVDVDAEVPSDARRDLREWAEKRRIDVRFLR